MHDYGEQVGNYHVITQQVFFNAFAGLQSSYTTIK